MHTVGRPVLNYDPILREDLLSFMKLSGEGCMEEVKTVTGWTIDTRRLLVILTDDKASDWSQGIQSIIDSNKTNYKEMDTRIGRLNHCCFIIPLTCHFIYVLRKLRDRSRHTTSLTSVETKYINLWLKFLRQKNTSFSINNIIYRQPTHIRWDDSCPIGIEDVSLLVRAYRFPIPRTLQGQVSNNALEFLAIVVGCWLDVHENRIQEENCILAVTDNSSCVGWMHK